jgi:hypothetical protein
MNAKLHGQLLRLLYAVTAQLTRVVQSGFHVPRSTYIQCWPPRRREAATSRVKTYAEYADALQSLQPHRWGGQTSGIGGTAGVHVATGLREPMSPILPSFKVMLDFTESDLDHTVHINIFLKCMADSEP